MLSNRLILFIRTYLILLFVIFFSNSAHSQGRVDGFYKGKGTTEIVLGGGAEYAKTYYAGKTKIGFTRKIYNANLFIAIGLFDKLDVYLSAPYIVVNSVRSIQDGSVFFKYRITDTKLTHGQLSLSIAAGFSGNLAPYQTEGGSAIGQQAKIIDLRPLIHYFSDKGWFATAQFAYNYKFEPTPNAFNVTIKLGKATSKYYVDIWYDYQNSIGGLDYRGTPSPSSFKELGVDYHKIGATYYKTIAKRLGGFIGGSYLLTGRNIGKGTSVNLGVVIKSN